MNTLKGHYKEQTHYCFKNKFIVLTQFDISLFLHYTSDSKLTKILAFFQGQYTCNHISIIFYEINRPGVLKLSCVIKRIVNLQYEMVCA